MSDETTEKLIADLEQKQDEADKAYDEMKQAQSLEPENVVVQDDVTVKTAEPDDQVIDEEIVQEQIPVGKLVEEKPKRGRPPKETYEQQYKVAQGLNKKLSQTINEYRDEIKELKDMVVNLQKRVATSQPGEIKPDELAKPVEQKVEDSLFKSQDYLTDEERETYGDTISLIQKVAREVVEDMLTNYDRELQKKLESKITPISTDIKSIQSLQGDTVRNAFIADIARHTPYAHAIIDLWERGDKHFENWLNVKISGTPFTRMDAFTRYNTHPFDAKGMAKLFNEYAQEVASGSSSPNPQPEPVSQPNTTVPINSVERLIEPENIRSETPQSIEPGKSIRHLSELSIAAEKFRRGEITGSDYDRIQAEIDTAVIEGRIA